MLKERFRYFFAQHAKKSKEQISVTTEMGGGDEWQGSWPSLAAGRGSWACERLVGCFRGSCVLPGGPAHLAASLKACQHDPSS